jgi:hypothetical protein
VTNSVLLHRLTSAPAAVRGQVPTTVDGISGALEGGHPSPQAGAYLREAVQASTHAVFVGLLLAAIVTIVLLLFVPRQFPRFAEAPAYEGAAQPH